MSKYRIDTEVGQDDWQPGRVTFHADTPRAALDDIAADFSRVLKTRVRIARVYEVTQEYIETVAVFDAAAQVEQRL